MKNFLSFNEVIENFPFSVGTLRRLLFDRDVNGLSEAILQRTNGRKLIFVTSRFEDWIFRYYSNKSIKPKLRKLKNKPCKRRVK